VVDIRGHKHNMCAAKKTSNNFFCKMSRECIKFPKFTKYQKTQKELSLDSNECSKEQKTEFANKNGSSLAKKIVPLNMFLEFLFR
jgi:hypothetical protein